MVNLNQILLLSICLCFLSHHSKMLFLYAHFHSFLPTLPRLSPSSSVCLALFMKGSNYVLLLVVAAPLAHLDSPPSLPPSELGKGAQPTQRSSDLT